MTEPAPIDAMTVPPRRFRRYPEYRDAGVEWLGEIPAHWRACAEGSFGAPGLAVVESLGEGLLEQVGAVEPLVGASPVSSVLEQLRGQQGDRKDDRHVTDAVLKTIAAFLNPEGGDLLIVVADDRTVLGIQHDRLDDDDKFMRHLAQAVRNGLGDQAGTGVDPKTQIVEGKTLCLVSCQRSPEPVFPALEGSREGRARGLLRAQRAEHGPAERRGH
jgi:hypothetical protein